MTAIAAEKNLTEKRDKRAKSIAAMGLVNREGDRFLVSTPSLRGKQTSYEVWRDETAKIRCNCLEFEEAAVSDAGFRCEHILAVKYALVAKNRIGYETTCKGRNSNWRLNPNRLRQKTKAQLSRTSPRAANRRQTKFWKRFRLMDKSKHQ